MISKSTLEEVITWQLASTQNPEAVRQFITANGTRLSDRERQQNQPPAIIIQK